MNLVIRYLHNWRKRRPKKQKFCPSDGPIPENYGFYYVLEGEIMYLFVVLTCSPSRGYFHPPVASWTLESM